MTPHKVCENNTFQLSSPCLPSPNTQNRFCQTDSACWFKLSEGEVLLGAKWDLHSPRVIFPGFLFFAMASHPSSSFIFIHLPCSLQRHTALCCSLKIFATDLKREWSKSHRQQIPQAACAAENWLNETDTVFQSSNF